MKASRIVASLLVAAAVCAAGFAVVDAVDANVHVGGALLGLTFTAFAAALVVWEHELMKHDETTEEMPGPRSSQTERGAAEETFGEGTRTIVGRRSWLARLLAGAAATVGVALLFPLRSFTEKSDAREFEHTSWSKGARLVRADGTPVNAADLEIDSIVTVFPEGHVGPNDANDMANAATVLVRVPEDALRLPPERASWAPQGLVAYSKVCTHAGCPVALYRAAAHQLFCPCHQSTFDVLRGGRRIFGPAARGLPQLPLEVAADGSLRAASDFTEPVGPGYWDRT